ncbi:MAG: alpha/beta hydrolase [Panacagrimonas sp.]
MQSPPEAVEACIARVRAVYAGWTRTTSIEQMRADWDALFPLDEVPATVERVDAGGVDARWIAVQGARADRVLVYFHGGGYKLGSTTSHQDLMARLSQAARCRVLGLNYRLMPEHRFPAPVEDAVAAYRWLLANKLGASNIAFAGDSAGGGLVPSAMFALRAQGLPLPAAGVMMSALTDFETAGASYETRAKADPIHQRVMIQALARQYLGVDGDRRDPLASPLYGALRGLPPLLLQVGDRETGLDDSTRFADAACAAGVDARCEVWDGMIHVFQQFACELSEARQAIQHIGVFLGGVWRAT